MEQVWIPFCPNQLTINTTTSFSRVFALDYVRYSSNELMTLHNIHLNTEQNSPATTNISLDNLMFGLVYSLMFDGVQTKWWHWPMSMTHLRNIAHLVKLWLITKCCCNTLFLLQSNIAHFRTNYLHLELSGICQLRGWCLVLFMQTCAS